MLNTRRRKEIWSSVLSEPAQTVGQCKASSGKTMEKAITQRGVRLTAARVVQKIPAVPVLRQAGAADAFVCVALTFRICSLRLV